LAFESSQSLRAHPHELSVLSLVLVLHGLSIPLHVCWFTCMRQIIMYASRSSLCTFQQHIDRFNCTSSTLTVLGLQECTCFSAAGKLLLNLGQRDNLLVDVFHCCASVCIRLFRLNEQRVIEIEPAG